MTTPQQMPIDFSAPYAPIRHAPSELSLSGNRLLGVTRNEVHPIALQPIFEEMVQLQPTARDLEWEFASSGYRSETPPSINIISTFDIDVYHLREGELPISIGYPAPPSKNEEIVKCQCKRAFLIVNKMTGLTRMGHKVCGYCTHNLIKKN